MSRSVAVLAGRVHDRGDLWMYGGRQCSENINIQVLIAVFALALGVLCSRLSVRRSADVVRMASISYACVGDSSCGSVCA